jgi:hypothetical protein
MDENGYKALQQWLKEDGYAEHKLRYENNNKALFDSLILKHRYDYFPSIKQFVLRRPSAMHEVVIRSVVEGIQHQLGSIAGRKRCVCKVCSEHQRLRFAASHFP